jgi:predicted transcriptional regulator
MTSWLDKAFEYGMIKGNKLAYENLLEKLKIEHNGKLFLGNLKRFVQEVAEVSNISDRQVYNMIKRLEELGILERVIINGKDYIAFSKAFGSRTIKLGRIYWEWLKA